MSDPNLPAIPENVSNLPVLNMDHKEIVEIIKDNLADSNASFNDLDKIKVPQPQGDAAMFTVQTLSGPQGVATLVGVVSNVFMSRTFWSDGEGTGNNPPDCTSDDMLNGYGRRGSNDDHDGPHDCASCPMNAFGSAIKDGKAQKGKACNERAFISLLMGSSFLPVIVQVPSTSLAAWRKYLVRLSGFGKKFTSVVTSIGLAPKKSSGGQAYCELVFGAAGELPPVYAERVNAYAKMLAESFKRPQRTESDMPGGDAEDVPPPFDEDSLISEGEENG